MSLFRCASVCIGVVHAVLFAASATAAPISLEDDLGRPVTLKEPAQRLVTLAPFLTELAFSAGAGDRVVGVSAHSNYPEAARDLPVVASAVQLSLEQIAALKPDFVLAWRDSIRREDIERLGALGAAVFVAQARRLEDVTRLLQVIGRFTGRDVAAIAAAYEGRLEGLRRANERKPRVDVFLEIWNRPLTTISGSHFMNDALEICHARNVFKDLSGVAPQVSWEALYERNPWVIVGAGSAANEKEFRANWTGRRALDAVKADRLVFVDADTIQRPTVRIPEGVAQLCARLDEVRARPSGSTRRGDRP